MAASRLPLVVALALLLASPHSARGRSIKELVALAPNAGGPRRFTALEWVYVEYPEGVQRAEEVTITAVGAGDPVAKRALGNWLNLDPKGIMLTAKIHGDQLFALKNSGKAPTLPPTVGGGCCADLLRIYPRQGQAGYRDIALDPLVQAGEGSIGGGARWEPMDE